MHLQSWLMECIPVNLKQLLLLWLDDFLLHEKTANGLPAAIRDLFKFCAERNMKLNPSKCVLYAITIRWYGRQISSDGIRYDPKKLEGLLKMEPPQTIAHLQQFICALQWVKKGIPTRIFLSENPAFKYIIESVK